MLTTISDSFRIENFHQIKLFRNNIFSFLAIDRFLAVIGTGFITQYKYFIIMTSFLVDKAFGKLPHRKRNIALSYCVRKRGHGKECLEFVYFL